MFETKNNILHADDISCHDLAGQYGTPSYIYSATGIRGQIRALQKAFANNLPADKQPLITFACKANSNLAVLSLIKNNGLGADVVSGGELKRARKAGIAGDKIVFSGVGKTKDEILYALDEDILQFNVESKTELLRIEKLAREKQVMAQVALRLNPNVDADTHDKITTGKDVNKFGVPANEIMRLYKYAHESDALSPRGLSMHIGSQIMDMSPYHSAFIILADLAQKIKQAGMTLEVLDLGGGLGIQYRNETPPVLEDYAKLVKEIISPLDTQVILEPGRFITGDSGLLLSRVVYVKETSARKFLILDAGMNDLIRPTLYDAHHPVVPVDNRPSQATLSYDIVGPVCETGDTFAVERDLPEMTQGDLVAIMVSGAYGHVMASNYNTRPRPPEILVSGQDHALIRTDETFEDIIRGEQIPDWLDTPDDN